MNKLLRVAIATICVSIMVTLAAVPALAERRVALVVGNSQYTKPSLFFPIRRTMLTMWRRSPHSRI